MRDLFKNKFKSQRDPDRQECIAFTKTSITYIKRKKKLKILEKNLNKNNS